MLIKRGYVMKKETLTLRFKGENASKIKEWRSNQLYSY